MVAILCQKQCRNYINSYAADDPKAKSQVWLINRSSGEAKRVIVDTTDRYVGLLVLLVLVLLLLRL